MLCLDPWMACYGGLRCGVEKSTGRVRFDLTRPSSTRDGVAHSLREALSYHLEHVPRFGGAVGSYSVAQHSALVRKLAWTFHVYGKSPKDIRDAALLVHALLHDAHEAFTGDIVTPVQKMLPLSAQASLHYLQRKLQDAIVTELDLPEEDELIQSKIKRLDALAALIERRWFFSTSEHLPAFEAWSIHDLEKTLTDRERIVVDSFVSQSPPAMTDFKTFLRGDLLEIESLRKKGMSHD